MEHSQGGGKTKKDIFKSRNFTFIVSSTNLGNEIHKNGSGSCRVRGEFQEKYL